MTSHELAAESLTAHVDALFRAAYALCGTRHDAEDLVQETYARVMSRPRVLRREHELAYLARALRNTWVDVVRSRASRPPECGADGLEFVVAGATDPDLVLRTRAVYAAIASLSPPLRETIVAVDILGLSYKEAARSLKTRKGTIMSRLYRAREQVAARVDA